MKRGHTTSLLFTFLLLLATYATTLTAQNLSTPRPSPAATLNQQIGMTSVTVNYSRPQVIANGNDRTGKVWGTLVAYGFNKINFASQGEIPWRAGANENTVITFSDDVKIEGKSLKAGSYGLHMAIHEEGKATLIFSKNTTSWGSFWYDEKEDALRVDVQMQDHAFTNVLTYEFVEFGPNHGTLALNWEKKSIPFKISIEGHEMALQSFRAELRGVKGFSWQGPLSAANYCLQNNINHEEAMTWADRAMGNNKNFQTLSVKSGLLLQMGKKEEAVPFADEASALANVNQLNGLGYLMLQNQQSKAAVKYFQLNAEKNPKNANCFDSLGEGYMALGENDKAIESFKKSLSLNPPPFVKANSLKNLEKLGVK